MNLHFKILGTILFASWSCLLYCSLAFCTESGDINFTEQESIEFITRNSDLIAVVNFVEGVEKSLFRSFFRMPKSVHARIVSIIKGVENIDIITINAETKFPAPGALKNKIILRPGLHLVFLCKVEDEYQPTTRFSVLDIANDKVYPIWKQKNSSEIINGYPLSEIIGEVNAVQHLSEGPQINH